jgi:hypothetical protein
MKKNHIAWLILGTLFWGVLLAVLSVVFFPEKNLITSILKYVVFTGILTLIVQYYTGGFIIITPKKWFFLPLICWIVVIVWGIIEITVLGEWSSF